MISVFTSGASVAFNSNVNLFALGGTRGASGDINNDIPLVLSANAIHSGVMNLTIAKDFNSSHEMTLSVFSRSPSGVAPLYTSGKLVSNNDFSLNIGNTLDPNNNTITLRTKGYLE